MNLPDVAGVLKANVPRLVRQQLEPLRELSKSTASTLYSAGSLLREARLSTKVIASGYSIGEDSAKNIGPTALEDRLAIVEHRAQRHSQHLSRLEGKVKALRDE